MKASDNIQQAFLVKWLSGLFRQYLGDISFPSVLVEHCVGTDRVLGVYFSDFFANRGELTSGERTQIAQLATICRTLIVIDDALRDEDLVGLSQDKLVLLRRAFYTKCEELLSQWMNNKQLARSLLQTREQQLNDVYNDIQKGKPPSFDMVRGKCAFLEIPFDALETKIDKVVVNQLKEQALTILSILQMADDYVDRLSDQEKPYFSNLISWGADSSLIAKKLQDSAELSAKYASLVIYILLGKLVSVSKDNARVLTWAEEAKKTIDWAGVDYADEFIKYLFPLSEDYQVPAVNKSIDDAVLDRLDILPKVQFGLSAELLHMLATKKAMMGCII